MNLSKGTYLYTGTVGHRRFTPFNHFFNYPLFMAYIDLNTVNHFLDKSWFWNVDKKAIISFNRKDYHGDPNLDLSRSVRKTVYETIGLEVKGPIRLLTHLSYFGYCFNPVSFYYCFDEGDTDVVAILAEVTNTPWKERFSYVLRASNNKQENKIKSEMKKELHVSPFWDMEHVYDWAFSSPMDKLNVFMKNYKDGEKVFDATLNLKRRILNKKSLFSSVFKYPFMTIKVVFWIHLQAFFLWLRGATFFIHPSKVKN